MGEIGNYMSALVKELLRNYYDIDDNSKLDLDTAIGVLIASGEFSEEEIIILQLTIDQAHHSEISKVVGWKKTAINDKVNKIAKKIADYLGAEYQDEKILKEVGLRLGRELTPEEEKFCWKVIRAGRSFKGLNIYNFKDKHDTRGKDKTKGQVDLQEMREEV